MSIRRACAVLGAGRSTYHYAARRPPQAVLSRRIREIAETRVRYGDRRIHVLLRREGWQVNAKRICRLYTEEGLQLRHKTPKRRVAAKLRGDRCPPAAPNEVRAMDFLSDQLFNGRRIRILTIVDAFSRLSPAIDVRPHYRGTDVVETLERVTAMHGTPKTIRLDNGPEFISKALNLWGLAQRRDAGLLPAGEARRQRLHRVVQWVIPGRVPERLLVPEPGGCPGKM